MLNCYVQRNQVKPKTLGTLKPLRLPQSKGHVANHSLMSWKGLGTARTWMLSAGTGNRQICLCLHQKGTFEARSDWIRGQKLRVRHTPWMGKEKKKKKSQEDWDQRRTESEIPIKNIKGIKLYVKQKKNIYVYISTSTMEWQEDLKDEENIKKAHYF